MRRGLVHPLLACNALGCCVSSYHTGSNRLHCRQRRVDSRRAAGIGRFFKAQAPACVALAGQQHLVKAAPVCGWHRSARAAAPGPPPPGRRCGGCCRARGHHVGQLAAVRGHAQALAQAFEQLGTALLVADVARQHIWGVVPLPRSCVGQAKRTPAGPAGRAMSSTIIRCTPVSISGW